MRGFNISIRGASHIKDNTPCQDFSEIYYDEAYTIAAVADGHGSKKHFRSNKGSEIAVKTSIGIIKEYISEEGFDNLIKVNDNKILKKIEKSIIANWNENIKEYHLKTPFSEQELKLIEQEKLDTNKIETIYGTTLIVCVITDNYYFAFQIGDGNLVVIQNEEKAVLPIPEDKRLIGNITTSLCDNDAMDNFRDILCFEKAKAFILSTDGLINSFVSKSAFINYNKLILEQSNDLDILKDNLKLNLEKRSEIGSRDDISVAVIINDKSAN